MRSVAILGSSKVGYGTWRPGKKLTSIAILGGADIDFRQAELEADVTEVVAISFLGGIKIIVPVDMPITLTGFSLLGSREVKQRRPKEIAATPKKALHVNAISIVGSCTITETE